MTKLSYTILNLIVLSLVIFFGVDIFYRMVSLQLEAVETKETVAQRVPDADLNKRASLDDFNAITDRNLFGSLEKASEALKTEEIETIENLEPTSLKIALLGTVTGDREHAFAVIEETDTRRQGLYKVGESVKDATVKMILREKVVLRVGTNDEILTMEESAASRRENVREFPKIAKKGSTITVNRRELQSSLADVNKLLSQVRIRPHFKDGESDGLSVTNIKPGSIFVKLGLRNGDVVKEINGKPITSPDDVLALYEKLKSGSRVSVQIARRNELKTLNYRFR